jgi:predicted nucleotidyltransferase
MISEEIKQYLVKVCTILNSHNVEYLVVGGAAVSHYGFSRPSGIGQHNSKLKADLDFWYNPTVENYQNLVGALDELKVDTTDLKKLVFDKKHIFLKIPHEDFHTDFLPVMEGLDSFHSANGKAEVIDISGVPLRVLSYDDLIKNKSAVNRKADQSDIAELDKIRKGRSRGKGI